MNFLQAVTVIRRRLGFINYYNKEDLYYIMYKFVKENKEIFDRLAKS